MSDDRPVKRLANLGPRSAAMLNEIGIATVEELRAIGVVKAYARIKFLHPRSASKNCSGVWLRVLKDGFGAI